jgi:hypothetical protein
MLSMLHEDFKHMDPATKTAIYVGGAAVVVGLAIAFWPKKAAAAGTTPVIAPPATQKWQATASLTPGAIYTVVATVPTDPATGQALDKFSASSVLSATGWSGQMLYYPGDPSIPVVSGLPLTPQPNQYIFQGSVAVPQPVNTQAMTAYALVG